MIPDIRRCEPGDLVDVASLLAAVLPDSQPHNNPAGSLARKLAHDNLAFVADTGSQLVGFVMAGYDGHRGWIYQLAVDRGHSGQGIGRMLVKAALQALDNLGCPKVNLQVRSDNPEVVGFYESLGFEVEPRISLGRLLN